MAIAIFLAVERESWDHTVEFAPLGEFFQCMKEDETKTQPCVSARILKSAMLRVRCEVGMTGGGVSAEHEKRMKRSLQSGAAHRD